MPCKRATEIRAVWKTCISSKASVPFASALQRNCKDSVACKKTVEHKYVPLSKA